MRCPSCGFENLQGDDSCANCGADLWTVDTPQMATTFQGRLLGEHLGAIEATEPPTIGPGESMDRAVELMRSAGVDHLLVMADGRLIGIVTDRDVVLKLADKRLSAFDVRDIMTRDPVVLRPDDTLAVAIHKMAVGGFRHIPVVDEGRPVTVIAAKDAFHHILRILG
ncbi:MAG TPA: CBS domain-containing protein [Candidatus Dormibacteraeota bacterium]|nr:CBS domain-containing protein [Candidatus Dormibacteraeota bacterium]